jgi:hypothetical protein
MANKQTKYANMLTYRILRLFLASVATNVPYSNF